MNTVENLKGYIVNNLGYNLRLDKVKGREKLPLYIRGAFDFYQGSLMERKALFAVTKGGQLNTVQLEKQFEMIRQAHNATPILVADELPALLRNRLIQKHINFVVPGKQMYLPALMVDLREVFTKPTGQHEKLLPVAQVILLFHILHKNEKTEAYPFKQWAARLNYTAMAVSQAAENLKALELCNITGTKEKYFVFEKPAQALWKKAETILIDPVQKRVYVDGLPPKMIFPKAGESALPEYTNMNASRQEFRATDKATYYEMVKKQLLVNPNDSEGEYCLEVWKYDPTVLGTDSLVDHISLYLSLRHNTDERIQMALGELADIW